MDDDGPVDSAVIPRKHHEIQLIHFATEQCKAFELWPTLIPRPQSLQYVAISIPDVQPLCQYAHVKISSSCILLPDLLCWVPLPMFHRWKTFVRLARGRLFWQTRVTHHCNSGRNDVPNALFCSYNEGYSPINSHSQHWNSPIVFVVLLMKTGWLCYKFTGGMLWFMWRVIPLCSIHGCWMILPYNCP